MLEKGAISEKKITFRRKIKIIQSASRSNILEELVFLPPSYPISVAHPDICGFTDVSLAVMVLCVSPSQCSCRELQEMGGTRLNMIDSLAG